jgi:hypothetical protein
MSDDNLIFFLDGYEGPGGYGGIYYRSMGLGKFIMECKEKGFDIVGIRINESNNCELLCSNDPDNVKQ